MARSWWFATAGWALAALLLGTLIGMGLGWKAQTRRVVAETKKLDLLRTPVSPMGPGDAGGGGGVIPFVGVHPKESERPKDQTGQWRKVENTPFIPLPGRPG